MSTTAPSASAAHTNPALDLLRGMHTPGHLSAAAPNRALIIGVWVAAALLCVAIGLSLYAVLRPVTLPKESTPSAYDFGNGMSIQGVSPGVLHVTDSSGIVASLPATTSSTLTGLQSLQFANGMKLESETDEGGAPVLRVFAPGSVPATDIGAGTLRIFQADGTNYWGIFAEDTSDDLRFAFNDRAAPLHTSIHSAGWMTTYGVAVVAGSSTEPGIWQSGGGSGISLSESSPIMIDNHTP